MSDANHIQNIIEDLALAGVDFIIAGGVAVVLHGISRATIDIDASVDMRRENLEKLIVVMKKNNMKPRAPVPYEFILDDKNIQDIILNKHALVFTFVDPDKPYKQLDIFLTRDLKFAALKDDVDIFQIGKAKVKVLNIDKLIEVKQSIKPPREKDLFDIAALLEIKGALK